MTLPHHCTLSLAPSSHSVQGADHSPTVRASLTRPHCTPHTGSEEEEEEEEVAAGSRHTVFGRALQAGSLHWSDTHLQKILASDSDGPSITSNMSSDKPTFDFQGHPVWLGEPFPTACARVDTLRAHGYPRQALRLAGAIVNTLRLQRRHQLEIYKQQKKGGHQYYRHVLGVVATQRVYGYRSVPHEEN